jgi:hypothetical protein
MSIYIMYGVLSLSLLFNIYLNSRLNTLHLRIEDMENERDLEKFATLSDAFRSKFEKRGGREDE